MDPSDPEYQEILDLLNEAVNRGIISDENFADAGLTYQDGVWVASDTPQTPTLGYADASHLPPSAPLLADYNAALNKNSYFSELTAFEKASLYRALIQNGTPSSSLLSHLQTLELINWEDQLGSLIRSLPSGEAGPALNTMTDFRGRTMLSGINLSGWNTTGLTLELTKLDGTNITGEQLSAANILWGANLSGVKPSKILMLRVKV